MKITNNYIAKNNEKLAMYQAISYEKSILDWLKKCQFEVQNITNLNQAFDNYIQVVKMITNQYKEKSMSFSKFLSKNKENYEMALEVANELPNLRKQIVNKFFDDITDILKGELGQDWTVEIDGNLSKKCKFPFRIYKKKWFGKKKVPAICF